MAGKKVVVEKIRTQEELEKAVDQIISENEKENVFAKEVKAATKEISMDDLEKMCEQERLNIRKKAAEDAAKCFENNKNTEEKIMNNKTNNEIGKVQKLTEEVNELITWAMKQAITSKTFLNMSDEDMICMRKVMVILNDALDIANGYRDYCYTMEAKVDNLEKKLDKVLEKLDEK